MSRDGGQDQKRYCKGWVWSSMAEFLPSIREGAQLGQVGVGRLVKVYLGIMISLLHSRALPPLQRTWMCYCTHKCKSLLLVNLIHPNTGYGSGFLSKEMLLWFSVIIVESFACFVVVLRQGLTIQPRLTPKLRFSCFSLCNAGITVMLVS